MTITWYGLSCFKVETRDAVLAFSPFSKIEEWGIQKSPRFKSDMVFVSQDSPAYNGVSGIEDGAIRIDETGEYEAKSVFVYGIATNNLKQKDAVANTPFASYSPGSSMRIAPSSMPDTPLYAGESCDTNTI